MSTRTYAMRSQDKPGWMIIAPINALTPSQWDVFLSIVRCFMADKYAAHDNTMTVRTISEVSGLSKFTVTATLKKLCDMGLFRYTTERGTRHYYRKVL